MATVVLAASGCDLHITGSDRTTDPASAGPSRSMAATATPGTAPSAPTSGSAVGSAGATKSVDGGRQVVAENHEVRDLSCAGGSLQVDGDDNRLTVTDPCAEVTVNGNDNDVRIAEVTDTVSVPGDGNVVAWAAGSPQVSNLGNDNQLGESATAESSSAAAVPTAAGSDTTVGRIVVSSAQTTRTIACAPGEPVRVTGASNTLTMTGRTVTVTVTGASNRISLAGAARIDVSGYQNTITYAAGAAGPPSVHDTGIGNVISAE